ncbi:uncharacterized protein LOC114538190 isoform X2 [Dendronephthya gigantea]|uniref:uncharacterized protein LOC114538190 isoform X2 n=1 Tax=Dendronephthya gigantea TaxID=151771 RepID=UPI00106C8D97|nr:uncharacterized protein LOC114538190 isoform X2 [Dendronephthya gigantea]
MMFKLRLVFVVSVTLLLFIICLLWTFVPDEGRNGQYFVEMKLGVQSVNTALRSIMAGVKDIRNDINKLQAQKPLDDLPQWIERFQTPQWTDFKPWRGVQVFFVSYRYAYLRKCVESIGVASADIDKSSVCVFVLHRTPKTTARDVNQTLEVIRNVTFCKVFVWKVKEDNKEKNYALRLKRHWWFVLKSVFDATLTGSLFNGWLLGYKHDILFVEEDTVLSPDFVKVMWYASEVKRRNADIIQFALGGWSGENMINAHPDTFIVRTARSVRGIAYGINQSTWLYFKSLEKDFKSDNQADWCESMGLVLGKHNDNKGFRIIVPTLSRFWHIDLKDTECLNSFRRWKGKDRNRIRCAKQPYVHDPCDVFVPS